MRLSQFHELLVDEFGDSYSQVLLNDLVLPQVGDQTGKVALDAGVDPKEVWLALCLAMDVPRERWHGKNKKNKKSN